MARGGYRSPANPAPVSGPGAQSRRTDGGAGSKTQPIRVPTGGDYGEASASRAQQQAAPLAAGGAPTPVAGAGGGGTPVPAQPEGVFGPTERPMESPLAGLAGPGASPPVDVDEAIQALYSVFPHPGLLKLMRS